MDFTSMTPEQIKELAQPAPEYAEVRCANRNLTNVSKLSRETGSKVLPITQRRLE